MTGILGRGIGRACVAAGVLALVVTGCSSGGAGGSAGGAGAATVSVVPRPAEMTLGRGAGFAVTASTPVLAQGGAEARTTAKLMAWELHLPTAGPSATPTAGIVFRLDPAAGTGPEGYRLTAGPSGVVITAGDGAGLF